MKSNRINPLIWKILLVFGGLLVIIFILNSYIMPWYVSEPETQVPKVIGKNVDDAITALKSDNLTPVIADTNFNDKYPKGTILFQRPNGGDTVKIDRRVYLFVSGGEPVVQAPQLIGKSVREAKFSLERLGLRLGSVQEVASDKPENMIFDQQFAQGTPLKRGDSVSVTISAGQDFGKITVPDLILKPLSEAESILADSSLKVGKINYQQSFSLLPNTVVDQYPSKGSKLNRGDAVDLFVTKASEN